jgi:hypothetical protein
MPEEQTTDVVVAEEITSASSEDIQSLILTLRGKQVLLDSDVARLYGYDTKQINQSASRNKDRFPESFRFQLTKEESEEVMRCQIGTASSRETMRSQNVTASKRNVRYQPYAYTEQGIAMLSGLLKSDIAVQVSINIMNAFVGMRKFIYANKNVFDNIVSINTKLIEHDNRLLEQGAKIDKVFGLLNPPEANKQWIFYQGQFYDAFEWVSKTISSAKSSITIIDNYADKTVLEMLKDKKSTVNSITIITKHPSKIGAQALANWTAQYGAPAIIQSDKFHDRFIILDDKEVYAVGASLKDLGKKCFEISKNADTEFFINYVKDVIKASI